MSNTMNEADVVLLLESQKDRDVARLARDRAVVKGLVGIFNASLELATINPSRRIEVALGLANKGARMADLGAAATGSSKLKAGAFVSSQMVNTIGLVKLAGFTPARATVYMGFAVAEKAIAAAGLTDQATFSKCQLAIASLATTTGLTLAVSGLSFGTAWIPGAVAISAELLNTYWECRQPLEPRP